MAGSEQSAGYLVLDVRVKQLERELNEMRGDFKSHVSVNDAEHKEMRAGIADGALSMREIKIMFSHIVETSDEMKDDIKTLGDASNKEKGWRAIIVDILKVILLLIGFIATGKFVL